MASLLPSALLTRLRKPGGGVFFLSGDEEFLREQAVDAVVTAHLDAATRDFNLDQVRGGEVAAEQLASLLATPPMMAEFRVVVIRDAQGLSNRGREIVETLLPAPPAGLALVLSAAIPAGSSARFYHDLRRHAAHFDFPLLDPSEAPGWIIEQATTLYEVLVEPDAARLLVSHVGSDLRSLGGELDKLASYVGSRQRVTPADVQAVTQAVPRVDRWAWLDLVAERRWAKAQRELAGLLDAGESGVTLVGAMGTLLLRLAIYRAGGAGVLERELAPRQRWMVRRLGPQADRWTVAELENAIGELLRTDRLLKSSNAGDCALLEELLLRLRSDSELHRAA